MSLFTAAMIAGLRRPAKSGRVMRTQKCGFFGGVIWSYAGKSLTISKFGGFLQKKTKKNTVLRLFVGTQDFS